jgi:hypothetical protein
MEGDMLDDVTLGTKDQGAAMPDRFPPPTPALSADSIRENARAKAVRASYEFWSTGNEALLEQAFAETFAEHPMSLCEPATNAPPSRHLDAPKKESK